MNDKNDTFKKTRRVEKNRGYKDHNGVKKMNRHDHSGLQLLELCSCDGWLLRKTQEPDVKRLSTEY